MAVQFILGRAGTGKTAAIYDQITALAQSDPLGPPIFLILPKQATFQAERELVARLGGFTRVRVVSFELLGRDILTHCGDVGLPEVTPLGRRLVLGHLLRKHRDELRYFTKSAATPGLTAELDATFTEFDRGGVDISTLEKLLEQFQSDDKTDPALFDKLSDVKLLMTAYDGYIGGEKIDPARRLSLVMKRVGECSLFKEAHIFVDAFFDFTGYEQRLLIAIAAVAAKTVVSLLVDPDQPNGLDDLSIFHRTERTYRSLRQNLKGVELLPPVVLRDATRFESPILHRVEANLFAPSPGTPGEATGNGDSPRAGRGEGDFGGQESLPSRNQPQPNPRPKALPEYREREPEKGLEKFEAPDVSSEVDAVARRIRDAVAGGLRYRQIGVLVRDLGAYQTTIAASFAEHGIPHFADVRRSATHHPLLLAARAVMQIASKDWPHEAVMTLVKSGLAGLSDAEADELENYVLQHRVRGRRWESPEAWPVLEPAVSEDDDAAPMMPVKTVDDSRKKLVTAMEPMLKLAWSNDDPTVKEVSTALFAVLQKLNAPAELAKWISAAKSANQLERAGEHEQVWSEFVSFFTQAVELLGDQPTTLADFMAVVDAGMEGFDLALAPPTTDQVLVGQVDRTRTPPLEMVFVLGLNEGIFPRPAGDTTLLSDRDRRLLRERLVDLDPETDRQLLDERFLAYLAFSRASSRLIVSRPTAGPKGRAAAPSLFWTELARLVPDAPTAVVPNASLSHPEQVSTPRQLLTGLMRWIRLGAEESDPVWPGIYQWFLDQASDLRAEGEKAWPALVYRNLAALSGDVSRKLFPVPLSATVGELEAFAACPFRHFARYGLKLGKREDPDVTVIDTSNAFHRILDGVVGDVGAQPGGWGKATRATARPLVRNHASVVGDSLRGDLLHGSARNRFLLERIEKATDRAMAGLMKSLSLGSLKPESTSIAFGPGREHPPYTVTTPAGDVVELSGRIDRVDRCGTGSEIVLIDYRMKVNAVQLDKVYHGLRLQLFASALVLNRDAERNRTVGVLEWPILAGVQSVAHPNDAVKPDDPHFLIRDKPRGVFDAGVAGMFDKTFQSGMSPVVSIKINKTGELGDRDRTDAVTADELESLLAFVDQKMGDIAGGITSGEIAVHPYMIGDETPCSRCEYRSVCRFEPGINRYNVMPRMKRTEVLAVLTGQANSPDH
jgi:ATP-dependent helicase/nuclease subunit B